MMTQEICNLLTKKLMRIKNGIGRKLTPEKNKRVKSTLRVKFVCNKTECRN